MFGKKNQPMGCFACGGETTRDDIHQHYLFCPEMNALRGLNRGLKSPTKTINQKRAEAGLSSMQYSGSAIEEVRQTSSTGGQKGTKAEAYSLIPTEPIATLARLMKKGAVKYEAHNWRKGYPASDSYDALTRHLHAWWSGENNDPEMQESHLAAVMFHCCVLMELIEKHPEFDDRYIPDKSKKLTDDLIPDPFDVSAAYAKNLAWLAHHGS